MSTEENSNNIESIILSSNNVNNITDKTNNEAIKEPNHIESYEQKIKDVKNSLKALLKKTLGKSLLNLETNNQIQLQLLTITTKSYKEFDNKINIMKKQVEENLKKKEENKKIKKIKVSKAKFRSRTSQKNNPKIKDFNKTLANESNKSLIKIRAKTTGRNDTKIPNSEKKPLKNNNISIKVETNNGLNNTVKLNKSNSNKFNLTEYSTNRTKKKVNNDMNNNMNNKLSSSNIKERKNSKEIKNLLRNNNSKNKINVIQKSQYELKSSSNLLSDSKERTEKEKNNSKLINRKNKNLDSRKSFDFSNRKIPKSKINTNYVKKNTEILTEKKLSSKKNIIKNNSKNRINTNEINLKTADDLDKILKERTAILEKMKKQKEETMIKEEEKKKKELEKEKEDEEKLEEERKKRELEIKQREEERKKQLEEEERKKDEERRKKQMEIEAQIQQEKIDKENLKKELEKQKELEQKKKLEEEERIRKEKEREEEERIKKEEMEKLELEMDKIKEEKIEELPLNIELNIRKNSNFDNFNEENKKNKEMNIQDLLELEEKNDQNFEYFHIKEEEEIKKDTPLIEQEEKKEEIKNVINTDNNINNNTPVILYRQISILELIHDAEKFSPILFEFLTLKDLLEFTSISKKIKRQRIYVFNLQKKSLLNNIGFQDEENLTKKIKEYEETYTSNELNEPYVEYHLSRGAEKAVRVLNGSSYLKIFRRPVLDDKLSPIYIAYRILFVFLGEINIAKITDDKLFWVKCTEYLNTKSDNGKIGEFIMSKFEKYNCDCKIVYYIEQLMKGKKDNISPSYFSKICGSTGLLIFLIKELLEYCGVIISTKKTQLSRIYQNLIFFRNIIDKLSEFNKTLENFNQ